MSWQCIVASLVLLSLLGVVGVVQKANASGASADYRVNFNQPNPKRDYKTQTSGSTPTDLLFYAPFVILLVVMSAAAYFAIYGKKRKIESA